MTLRSRLIVQGEAERIGLRCSPATFPDLWPVLPMILLGATAVNAAAKRIPGACCDGICRFCVRDFLTQFVAFSY
jgi:hypothetical protein